MEICYQMGRKNQTQNVCVLQKLECIIKKLFQKFETNEECYLRRFTKYLRFPFRPCFVLH